MSFKVTVDESQSGRVVIKKAPLALLGYVLGRIIRIAIFAVIIWMFVNVLASSGSQIFSISLLIGCFIVVGYFSLQELVQFYAPVTIDTYAQTVEKKGEIVARQEDITAIEVAYVLTGGRRNRRRFYNLNLLKGGEKVTIDRIGDREQAFYAGDAIADRFDKPLRYTT